MESYRPGAPAMTCRVLQGGGGVARMSSRGLRRRHRRRRRHSGGLVVAAPETGDEGDLFWTGRARPRPGVGAGLRLWSERNREEGIVTAAQRQRH